MWRCRKLKIRNYRAYRGIVELDLPESGLYRVAGASGAGKSSLLSVIPYLLGYGRSPTSRSTAWGEKVVEVEGVFADGTRQIVVSRGTSGLKIHADGRAWTAKAGEDKLREILGVSTDLMEALTRRRQGVSGTFVSLDNAGRADLLAQLLGVGEYDEKISGLSGEIQRVETEFEGRKARLEDLTRRLTALRPLVDLEPQLRRASDSVRAAQEASLEAQRALKEASSSATERNGEVDQLLLRAAELRRRLVAADQERYGQASRSLSEIQRGLDSIRRERSEVVRQLDRRARLEAEADAVLRGTCVTCGAKRDPRIAVEIQAQLSALPTQEALVQLDRDIEIGDGVLKGFRFEPDPTIAALDRRVFELGASRVSVPEEFRDSALAAARRHDSAVAELRALEQQAAEAASLRTERSRLESAVREAEVEIGEVGIRVAELEDLRELLRRWISAYFEEVLIDLSERASHILATVPNVEEWRIDFRSEVQTKRGTTRRGVFAVPQHRGEERSLDGEDLSGGMKSAVYLAVDLALASLVAERTGASLGWLLIDEAFDGLDQPSRERCLEMVQTFARERGVLVLLVTHACEVQEALDGVISVEATPEGSKVRVIES